MADVTHGTVELEGATIAFSEQGSGPTAVYAHGLSGSRAQIARFGVPDLSGVVETGRLVTYDARGHGESTGAADPTSYTWSSLADDLLELLDTFSPDEPVAGIGTSMGTATLLFAALRRPERFSRLVLTAPPTAWQTRAGQTDVYRQMADLVDARGTGVLAGMMAAAPVPELFLDVAGYPPEPDVRPELAASIFRGAGSSDLPLPDDLRALDLPVLLLPWATDPGHPVSTAEILAAHLPDAEMRIASSRSELAGWREAIRDFVAV